MASSFQFRNVNTYVVEPEGEPIQSLPSKSSLDFSPQSSCIEEAPDDGNQYARQSKSWEEVVIPANTSDLNNDSGFITDSSLTKENIVGLKFADSPEFADTQITPLAVESTYTSTVWSYLVELFTNVPKSVKEHIVKGWTVIENLKSRVTFLENNLIASITLTESVASLEIQLPTPEQDIEVEVDCTTDIDGVGSALRVNDAGVNEYVTGTSQTQNAFNSYVARHSAKGTYRFTLINGYVFLTTTIQQIFGNISTQTPASRTVNGYIKTPQSGINKITFAHQINAGSVIKVRRVKRHA